MDWCDDAASFAYVKSSELSGIKMRVKVGSLEGKRSPPSCLEVLNNPLLEFSPVAHPTKHADLFVQCQVFDGKRQFSLKSQTAYKHFTTRWNWNEWLQLPVLVCDLPRNAKLVFSIWDTNSPGQVHCIGTTSVDVFDNFGEMNCGLKDLRVVVDNGKEDSPEIKKVIHQMEELTSKIRKYARGDIPHVDWMDRLAFREIEQLNEKLKKSSKCLYLNIEFPVFKCGNEILSVQYYEQGSITQYKHLNNPKYCKLYDPSAGLENITEKKHLALARSLRSGLDDRDIRPNVEIKKRLTEIMEYPPTTVLSGMELDLVWKHRYYLSEHKAGLTKFVKCINWDNPDQKKAAKEMLNSWAVLDAENALELLGPSFTVPEVRQYAVRRLGESSDDDLMLYLLQLVQALRYEPFTPDTFTFNEAYYSDDFDIIPKTGRTSSLTPSQQEQPVMEGRGPPSEGQMMLGYQLSDEENTPQDVQHRGTERELPSDFPGVTSTSIDNNDTISAASLTTNDISTAAVDATSIASIKERVARGAVAEQEGGAAAAGGAGGVGGLLELLVQRACQNLPLATSLYWFLKVECDSSSTHPQTAVHVAGGQNTVKGAAGSGDGGVGVYRHALDTLMATLRGCGSASARHTAQCLIRQDKLVNTLVTVVQDMRSKSLNREQKCRFLKNSLSAPALHVASFRPPLPLPLDPTVHVIGLDLENVHVFKSALEPCKLSFITTAATPGDCGSSGGGGDDSGGDGRATAGSPHLYHTIFKVGDDLRQDQLILQLLTLLERLLLRENLDLKLTPYRVLATAPTHGFVQFIDARVLADVLREDMSILNFLRKEHPDADAPLGVAPQVLDNYIRSCAGYSIITYILGVGDRHHDNLMITSDGCFFHIDFGYILGRDPKPMPPLIKLSRDITDGLGGQGSEQYQQFKQLCRTTFLSLRRHANLVLNLFSLMVDASIPDIALEPEKAVKKVEERLHLDLTDEQASSKILSVLHESANAVMGAVADNLHKFTQYIRN